MFALDLFVAENTFVDNLSGAVLMYGGPVLLLRNEISGSSSPSTGFGVLLKDVAGCDAVENVLVGNRIGIQVDGPAGDFEHETVIHGNTIALNQYGVSLYPSAHATFYRNRSSRTRQVVAQGTASPQEHPGTRIELLERLPRVRPRRRGATCPPRGGSVVVDDPRARAQALRPARRSVCFRGRGPLDRARVRGDSPPLMDPHSRPQTTSRRGAPAAAGGGGPRAAGIAIVRPRPCVEEDQPCHGGPRAPALVRPPVEGMGCTRCSTIAVRGPGGEIAASRANGTGKSTLLRCVPGYAFRGGLGRAAGGRRRAVRLVGYMPQAVQL
jgi:hypothetical protein